MGLSIRQRSPDEMAFDPSAQVDFSGTAGGTYGGGASAGWGPFRESPLGNVASWDELINSLGSPVGPPTSVNTGNQFSPTSGFDPFNQNPYNIDNITQPRTDFFANPTSGWESFAPTTGVNPFNTNPFNIDNITQPTFNLGQYNSGFPNQLGVYAYPGNLGYSVNPSGSMFGGIGNTGYQTRGNR